MPLPEPIAEHVRHLDPAAQAVVAMVWHMHEEQLAEFHALREQLAELHALREQGKERDARLEVQQAQLETHRKMLFGSRSEKLPPISSAVRRAVDEEELTPAALDLPATASDEEIEQARSTHRRARGRKDSEAARERRRKTLAKLPVVREQVRVSDDQLPKGTSREDYAVVGEGTIVRRIEHVREHLVLTEYVLETLSQRGGDAIVQAQAPPGVIERGAWAPSVYAQVVVSKCVDSMPLYRQERTLGRAGFAVARSVLCDLFHRAADVLAPLYERLLVLACQHPYVHADETKIRVGEPKRARSAWVWTVLCEDIVAYVFSETRAGENANRLLGGTKGVLIVDGYAGYNGVVGDDGRLRAGCWAHTRRKFFDALSSAPQARELLDLIVALYRIERDAADNDILGTARSTGCCAPSGAPASSTGSRHGSTCTTARSSRRARWAKRSRLPPTSAPPSGCSFATPRYHSITISPNAHCGSWPSDERTISSSGTPRVATTWPYSRPSATPACCTTSIRTSTYAMSSSECRPTSTPSWTTYCR